MEQSGGGFEQGIPCLRISAWLVGSSAARSSLDLQQPPSRRASAQRETPAHVVSGASGDFSDSTANSLS